MDIIIFAVKKRPPVGGGPVCWGEVCYIKERESGACYSITRAGSDLLFRVLRQSTIGVKGFHCRVRDGIECISFAITTGSSNAMVFRSGIL